MHPRAERGLRSRAALACLLGALLLGPALAQATPPLPIQQGSALLSALSLPAATPGSSSKLAYVVTDPFGSALSNLSLVFALYAFNPSPGTGATSLPLGAPQFVGASGAASSLTLRGPDLVSGATWYTPVELSVPSGAPLGTYAVRDSLVFTMNGSAFQFESRGFFGASQWASATVLPNGSPTLNLSRLGVSGVLPETGLLVSDSAPVTFTLDLLLAAALVFAGVGAYLAGKRPAGSKSGAVGPPREKAAPTAFGKRRKSDGD
ncbi:MAG: hypothetical protein L3K04_06795 [Thermoplasmata archaeon]|nr:hypothetical protein [Thermoplasmata archaeon]